MNDEIEELALEDHIELSQRTAKLLPKLVEVLRELPAAYRDKAIRAATILLQEVP